MRLPLTDEQKRAAATYAKRAFIEAGPGAGKTTVAAERYGVLRFDGPARGSGGLMALSFARSACGELQDRIRRRWGSHALRWPHAVWTLDSLHCAIVVHLLRTGAITWPGGHTQLTVHDTWQGQAGSRPLRDGYQRVVTLKGRQVVSASRSVRERTCGYSTKQPYETMLASGVCTHDEIRQIVEAAIPSQQLRAAVVEYLRASITALIVDEVFDGDALDLRVVWLAAAAGIPSTLIGDPWQALYEFRGAEPERVWDIVTGLKFKPLPVRKSFRFESAEMQDLARELRNGAGVQLHPGDASEVDVVLASQWRPLWDAADTVLPVAFGQIGNRTDAAMAILLEQLVSTHFGRIPTRAAEAALILDLDPAILRGDQSLLTPVLDCLAGGTPGRATAAMALLRKAMVAMESKPIGRLKDREEAKRIELLEAFARRLGKTHLVPGMTIHQAKGREWTNVGIRLLMGEQRQLGRGLSQREQSDRALYVALTRAKQRVRMV
jgi:DNA helicase-2/ATP-dependent DNA helicase PcrA